MGKSSDWLTNILAHANNPFVALMGSVLITAIVQSSSFTTALIITLVAATNADGSPILSPATAVYAIMGANIGTSVTNTIVSFGNVRIKRQFRRAFTAAIVHDIFNWLTVAMLFPLEWITDAWLIKGDGGILKVGSQWLADFLALPEVSKPHSPVKVITKPVVNGVEWISEHLFSNEIWMSGFIAGLGLILLFISLSMMVKNLKGALLRRIEGMFRRVFFRNDVSAYGVGAMTTVLVQSSSVTTSLIVPLAGAGAVKLKRVFPYTLGANLGTTVTGVIAATANPVTGAVTVAIAHVTFNILGTLIWYPLRRIPIGIARWYGDLASRSKRYALFFLFGMFVIVPFIGVFVTEWMIRIFSGS